MFRLALQVGEWDVDAIAERMSISMFWEWLAYFRISPWGDEWRRSGRLATVVAAAMGAKVNENLEDRFMPGGGRLRGMNEAEVEMLEQLKKIDTFREQIERRR